jgi:hypothetical protein
VTQRAGLEQTMNDETEFDEFAPWLVLGITLLGGFLRVLMVGAKGMWLDETFSVWMASHTLSEMMAWLVRIDQHPPLYYFLLNLWITINGDTPYAVRLLSVLFSTATIPVIYLIGNRMSGAVVGLAAALLLALSPFHIFFAQETRMYTLLTFNAAVAIYALVWLLTDARAGESIGAQVRDYWHVWRSARHVDQAATPAYPDQELRRMAGGWSGWLLRFRPPPIQLIATDLAWSGLVVFTVATMLSHNTAIFFPVATNLFVLGLMLVQRARQADARAALPAPAVFQAPRLANWVKAQLAILLLWSPWAFFFIQQASGVYRRFWIPAPTWDAVVEALRSFVNAPEHLTAGYALVIWGVYGVVLGLGLVHFRRKWSQLLFLVTLFVIPFAGELIVSVWRPIFYGRTLIWTTIPLFLLLAAGIAQLRVRFLMITVVAILVANNLFTLGDYHRFFQKEDWNTAAGYVANFAEPNDLVLFNSNFVIIPFNYYFEPYEALYGIEVQKQGLPLDLFEQGVLEPEMTTADLPELTALLREHDRVWLVYSHNAYTDPLGLIPQTLAEQKELARTRDFYGGQVQLYTNP